MADYVLQALEMRLADIKAKLAARTGQPGYEENVEELKAAIAEISAEIESRKSA